MRNAMKFREKLENGRFPIGSFVSFTDATVTEALSSVFDWMMIDAEHNAFTNESIQSHIMATKDSDMACLVRVPFNDPVLIKPVLDVGADGIIVPLIQTAEDVKCAVSACLYPPQGIRGFGPRRPTNYCRDAGPDYIQRANDSIVIIVQIEHIEAVRNIDEILEVPGLTAILIGQNDLSGSMGRLGDIQHPEVVQAVQTIIEKSRAAGKYPGIATGSDPDRVAQLIGMGIQWILVDGDFLFLLQAADRAKNLVLDSLKQLQETS